MAGGCALSPFLLWLMTIATGAAVASNYYPQPLLDSIATDLGVSYAAVGIIVTVSQVGYGVGLMFLVPLGDKFEKRRLIVLMMALTAAGLLISGLAPSLPWLLLGTAMTGLFSAVTQVLVPFAALMAPVNAKGRAVGMLMSGLLIGILLGRTVSGGLSSLGSWRIVYFVAAAVLILLAVMLWRSLPTHRSETRIIYNELIGSVVRLFKTEPILRQRALLGFLSFVLFALFWTPLAFLLSQPPYQYSEAVIGLFGLAGIAGALAANWAGRMTDRGKNREATLISLVLLLVAWLPLGLGKTSLAALIIGVVVLDLAAQLLHVSNMGAVMRINPELRNRLNSGYMTVYFLGGASGSFAAATIYQYFGWDGIVTAGVLVALVGLVFGGRAVYRTRAGG